MNKSFLVVVIGLALFILAKAQFVEAAALVGNVAIDVAEEVKPQDKGFPLFGFMVKAAIVVGLALVIRYGKVLMEKFKEVRFRRKKVRLLST